MNNDVDNDQQIIQDENIESLILGEFTLDVKDQIIEELAEGIMSRILSDERIRALSSSKSIETKKKEREDGEPNYIRKVLKNTETYISLKDLVPENNKALSSVLNKHGNTKKYLQIVRILYEELSVEHQYFPFTKDENHFENTDQIIEILMRLESFMLALIYKSTPAFIYYGSESTGRGKGKESPSALAQRMTNLGREFLFIWSKKNFIRSLGHGCLTNNIKVLVDFFTNLELNFRTKTDFRLELDLTLDLLKELNAYLMQLKAFAESGQLKKRLAPQQLYRTRDGDEEPELFFVRPSRIKFNRLWDANSTKWKDAIEYFHSRFKDKGKSILLYRAEIRLSLGQDQVTAKQFQNFFGAFNKKANTPNGLSGYSDFLYFWKEDFSNNELVLDLVSIFEADTLVIKNKSESDFHYHDRNICKELGDYLRNSLDKHKELFNDNTVELKFSPIPILLNPSYELAPEFLIEAGEQKKWNIFENKIIPYFVFMETFDLPYSEEIGKRFSRSQKKSG